MRFSVETIEEKKIYGRLEPVIQITDLIGFQSITTFKIAVLKTIQLLFSQLFSMQFNSCKCNLSLQQTDGVFKLLIFDILTVFNELW